MCFLSRPRLYCKQSWNPRCIWSMWGTYILEGKFSKISDTNNVSGWYSFLFTRSFLVPRYITDLDCCQVNISDLHRLFVITLIWCIYVFVLEFRLFTSLTYIYNLQLTTPRQLKLVSKITKLSKLEISELKLCLLWDYARYFPTSIIRKKSCYLSIDIARFQFLYILLIVPNQHRVYFSYHLYWHNQILSVLHTVYCYIPISSLFYILFVMK